MQTVVWQLPVIQSNKTDHDWVHPKAKYHAFLDNNSLCERYGQTTNYFETSIDQEEIFKNPNLACKKCLRKLNL